MFDIRDRVLCIAPHADDETIGCGGTISLLNKEGIEVIVYVVTGPGETAHPIYENRVWDIVRDEFAKANTHLGSNKYIFGNLPAAILTEIPKYIINKEVLNNIRKVDPSIILLPSSKDLHNDHKLINYSVNVATRPHLKENNKLRLILEYEVLSETNIYHTGVFTPNLFIDISKTFNNKLKAFSEYKSQIQEVNQPRSPQSLENLARLRGSNINKEYAEAFEVLFYKI